MCGVSLRLHNVSQVWSRGNGERSLVEFGVVTNMRVADALGLADLDIAVSAGGYDSIVVNANADEVATPARLANWTTQASFSAASCRAPRFFPLLCLFVLSSFRLSAFPPFRISVLLFSVFLSAFLFYSFSNFLFGVSLHRRRRCRCRCAVRALRTSVRLSSYRATL